MTELRDDLNDDGSWECPVENCEYWLPAGMTYLAYDHQELHSIIEQAFIDGYGCMMEQMYDRDDEEVDELASDKFEFKDEYDWWNGAGSGDGDERPTGVNE